MYTNFFKAAFAFSSISFLLSACQKDVNETSLSQQVQHDKKISQPGIPTQLASNVGGVALGMSAGPGGDLFIPDGNAGEIFRVDPATGSHITFASGLPQLIPAVGIGGITDVAFIGGTAYALVSMVDDPNLFPTGQVNGIYRIDGPNSFTIVADIGAFNLANPPTGFEFFVATGVLYSIEKYRGGFLVTDGHLNRVLYVTLDGKISVLRQFGDVVPTGLAVRGNKIYLSQAGPVPHHPEDGKVLSFSSSTSSLSLLASGAPMLVDVEFGIGQTVFALSQGVFGGGPDGSPGLPNTGSLLRISADGTFSVVADELNQPTSIEIIGNTAYVVTLNGELWKIENIASPPFGGSHH
jgi:hypothetical protein